MRSLFGVVSLLVVLAVVGILAVKQLRAVGQLSMTGTSSAPGGGPPASVAAPTNATVREQSQQLQQRVGSDVKKALEQGAVTRGDESQK
jgi:hypothetical protein